MGMKYDRLLAVLRDIVIDATENEAAFKETAKRNRQRMGDVLVDKIDSGICGVLDGSLVGRDAFDAVIDDDYEVLR